MPMHKTLYANMQFVSLVLRGILHARIKVESLCMKRERQIHIKPSSVLLSNIYLKNILKIDFIWLKRLKIKLKVLFH